MSANSRLTRSPSNKESGGICGSGELGGCVDPTCLIVMVGRYGRVEYKVRMITKHFSKAATALILGLGAVSISTLTLAATPAKVDAARHDQALEILRKSIGFRTVTGGGQVPVYAEYLKGVLVASGFAPEDIRIEPVATSGILIARYRGTDASKKPIVVNGHMDVVEANPKDWERDPFTAVVENGYVFGRGSVDNKFDVSMVTATLANLKRSGWKPRRDIVLALSGDEETEMDSTRKLAQEIKGAELVLNADGGGGLLSEEGKPVIYTIQAAEKMYTDFILTVTDPGGHSSRPGKTNAIYQLSRALGRLDDYEFPAMQNEITRAYFKASAPRATPPIAEAMNRFVANPNDEQAIATLSAESSTSDRCAPRASPLRSRVAMRPMRCRSGRRRTSIAGSFRAPPRRACAALSSRSSTIPQWRCQDRPGSSSIEGQPSPLRPDVLGAVTKAVHARYPGLTIVPGMSAGATDSMFFAHSGFRATGRPASS